MKFFKKNQVIIYVIALMLVVAGYLSYTTGDLDSTALVSSEVNEIASTSNVGDARLVSGNIEEQQNTVNQSTENVVESETDAQSTANAVNTTDTTNAVSEGQNAVETSTTSSTSSSSDNYFKTSKLERDTMYSQMLETYQKVIDSENSLETQRQSATEEITKINNIKNSIMICENLIGTKGFENNVIFVNGDSVTAIIGATELKQEDVAQIQNIISRELNASIENIHIAIK